MTKRIFDVVFSFLGLLLLSPVFLLIALLVIATSPGPVFYQQIRVGRNGRDFNLLKFRTMFVNSDKKGLLTVGARDLRITSCGFFLRKYKLDELPQLINVLRGDMSLVGPRPEVRKYVNMYNEEQLRVISVKPGITDIASIEFRNENDLLAESSDPEKFYIEEIMPIKLALNLKYIQKNNLFLDIRLLYATLMKVLTH